VLAVAVAIVSPLVVCAQGTQPGGQSGGKPGGAPPAGGVPAPVDKTKLSPNERVDDVLKEFETVKTDIEKLTKECKQPDDDKAQDDPVNRVKKLHDLGARLIALGDLRKALSRGGADDATLSRYKRAMRDDVERLAYELMDALRNCIVALGVNPGHFDAEGMTHRLYHAATAEKHRILRAYGLPVEPIDPKERWLVGSCEHPGDCPLEREILGEDKTTRAR
jgi:hypothetical protein